MKKMMFFILVLAALLIFPLPALAVDYSIDQMQIDAYLLDDGNVNVTEKQTYVFEGEFNGITRSLIPKEGTKIVNVEATENGEKRKIVQEDNEYKIYRSGKDEQVTIELSYTIEGGVDRYTDVAQFYWPFFDKSNESDYEQLDVFIHPPEPTDNVIAFGYDEAMDTAKTEADGTAHFAMGNVPEGENGDIRVAYDATLFPNADLTADKPMRDEILQDKADQEAKQAAFEKRKSFLDRLAPYMIGVFVVYFFVLLLSAWRKKQATDMEIRRTVSKPYFVPKAEMSMPATISFMRSGMLGAEGLTASFLDLVRKGYVKQEADDMFTVSHRNTDDDHEKHLIHWLFDKVGKAGTFRFADLKAYTEKKSNQSTYRKDYQTWQQAVRKEVTSSNLYKKKTSMRIWVALSGIFLILPLIFFAIHYLFMWMFFSLLLGLLLIMFAGLYHPKTLKGGRIKYQWKAFQEKYPQLESDTWNEQLDDDQKRAFIYGIGINDKQIKKKNKQLLEPVAGVTPANADLLAFIIIASSLNRNFSHANSTASATSTGGTPGGGAGVGGGGGGSGAF
ncbi:MAG TPA: DUF2207 domain-containing protein [Candidatus Avamphibacillus sp.]|nr:DUF2207 domain-containing protein [Candidatus Avamphibacillus sp.]